MPEAMIDFLEKYISQFYLKKIYTWCHNDEFHKQGAAYLHRKAKSKRKHDESGEPPLPYKKDRKDGKSSTAKKPTEPRTWATPTTSSKVQTETSAQKEKLTPEKQQEQTIDYFYHN